MSEDSDRKIIESGGGILNDLATRIKLILRLMADSRVHPLFKLLPIGSLVYFIVPDLIPTPIDDVAIIWLGSYLFVELCPPDVVKEHLDALNQVVPGQWKEPEAEPDPLDEQIIEADYWEAEE
ncbi:hypothetical protein ACFLZW_00415 [Chloroflexota bacterium]